MDKLVIAQDKANHAIYGALVFALVAGLAMHTSFAPIARGLGVGAAVAVGLAKEAWDYVRNRQALKAGLAKPHGVEGSDLLWTAGGALLVCVAAALTDGAQT
jgi:hypothetical protein